MDITHYAARLPVAVVAALFLSACADEAVTTAPHALTASALGAVDREFRGAGAFKFEPLAASYTCTVSGGDPVNPVFLPEGLTQQIIVSEPQVGDAIDMNTQNENGAQRGRYLYRPAEGSVSEVSVTDLENLGPNGTRRFAFRADWESLDPIVWTPWGTLLIGEETNAASKPDPDVPQARAGLVYELYPNAADPTKLDRIVARPAIGAKSHEGMRFDRDGNLYSISERNPGYVYKFVPDRRGDLSTGQLYALKITSPTGDRTGGGVWIPLDRTAVQVDASVAADGVGATGYNRPEDVEMGTSSGNFPRNPNTLFVAVTGRSGPADNRIIAIDLNSASAPFAYDYVRIGVNTTAEFDMPDNVALDRQGNLYIAEDPGGSFPAKTKGDDIWVARPGAGKRSPASSVERLGSLTDCDAEPTGLYWDLRANRLFVNVQHRGGDRLDKAVGIVRSRSGIGENELEGDR